MFRRTSGHKLLTLKAEILELGEWIGPIAKDSIAWLEVSHDIKVTLCDTLQQTCECNSFQWFNARMNSFKIEFNEEIPTVEQQVKRAKKYRRACAKTKAGNNS